MDDEDRKVVLRRRARFIAAALTSAGLASAGCNKDSHSHPEVCLSQPPQYVEDEPPAYEEADADAAAEPLEPPAQVCLSQPAPEEP